MFELNFKKIDDHNFSMQYVALTNLFAAWFMLNSLKTSAPSVDTTLARIYFSEYGMDVAGAPDKAVAELAKEYYSAIKNFFIKAEVQRCENIIDRFGKCGCDNRLPHAMTLPGQCKEFFEEILHLNSTNVISTHTKETQCLDSLLDTIITNNTFNVSSNMNGMAKVDLNRAYNISPEQFSSYTDIVHNAVIDLYRPLCDLDETHEDWGTKFRKVINYIKTLVFMVSRDVAFNNTNLYRDAYSSDPIISDDARFHAPLVNMGQKDKLFDHAVTAFKHAYYGDITIEDIKSTVAPYGGLSVEHAICLFHNTNAKLDVTKIRQSRDSESFKFLCCQEMISFLDAEMKAKMLVKSGRGLAEPSSEG